jgi:L-threonylcarbamoyladenylate synthase
MTVLSATAPGSIDRAAQILQSGGLVAFPTETVYGLGADATNDTAVAAIYAAKGRPEFNPLIAHVADLDALSPLVRLDDRAAMLATHLWPGPLTLVLPRAPACPVSLLASAGLDTLAVRIPNHPVARALLRATGRPVVAPSANLSGKVSPTTAQHVADGLAEKVDLILAGGRCTVGLESTILDLSTPTATLLRPGAVTLEDLSALIGPVAWHGNAATDTPIAPGQLKSHYAPQLPVRLNALTATTTEAHLTFGPTLSPQSPFILSLSDTGDLTEAAANLFAHLRTADSFPCTGIAVMPIPETGLGVAINDRLRRAAEPRS